MDNRERRIKMYTFTLILPNMEVSDVVIGLRCCQVKSGGLHLCLAFSATSTFFQAKVKDTRDISRIYVQQKITLDMHITAPNAHIWKARWKLDFIIENFYIQGSMEEMA